MRTFLRPLAILLLTAGAACLAMAQTDPQLRAGRIAGNWQAQAELYSALASNPSLSRAWQEAMWGSIDPSGKLAFSTQRGCRVSGLLIQLLTEIRGTAQARGCAEPDMNRQYSISARLSDQELVLRLTALDVVARSAEQDVRAMEGTFSRY